MSRWSCDYCGTSSDRPSAGGVRPAAAAAAPPALSAEDASMRVRYTSGTNREGRRRAQLCVGRKWLTAVQRGLARFGKPWTELPGDRSDYDILEELPPLES